MSKGWEGYEQAAEKGPFSLGLKIILLVAALGVVGWVVFGVIGVGHEAAQVAHDELGPRAMQQKYDYFKDLSASLDAQLANIDGQRTKLQGMETRYGKDFTKWPEDRAAAYDKADTELRGMVMNFNKSAADYNAEMSKWYTRFTNMGMLPEGAKDAPRREFRTYIYN